MQAGLQVNSNFTVTGEGREGIAPENLHLKAFLEQVLPGFKWRTWRGFLLGLVESFLYAVYAGIVFVPIYNFLKRRWGDAQS
jgi:hypothetical protein